MVELIPGLPDNVLGFKAVGKITGEDYETVVIPEIESRLATHDKLRAVYECGPGGPAVRVYAVLFREPTGAARAAVLEANPDGVMFKGQLAGVVLADEDACESCYEAVKARAEQVLGK